MEKKYLLISGTPGLQKCCVAILRISFLLFSFFAFESNLYGQSPSIITSSGTWICPQGVTSISVEAIGGGGGGRNAAGGTKGFIGGGGGGGAYAKRANVAVVPGTPYAITVGAAGATNLSGSASTATFGAVTITAAGGSVGAAASLNASGGLGGTVAGSIGDAGSVFAGGAGGSGVGSSGGAGSGSGGGGGSGAGSAVSGNAGGNAANATTPGAGGALIALYGGAGGAGGNNTTGASAPATNYGGGGGGGGDRSAGGSGRQGAVIITFNCPINTIANAGPDQTLASCATSATLSGNTATYGTGTWTLVSGIATITSPTSPTSTVTGLALGASAVLRWTIDNGQCGSTNDTVTITTVYGSSCLTYCAAGGATAASSYISNISLNTINQNSAAWGGYRNFYPTLATTLYTSSSYTISVSIYNFTTSQKNISAWIDWNLNGVFDIATETVLSTTSTVAAAQTVTLTNTFTVPAGAVIDLSRLRVELAFNAEGAAAPCNVNSLTDVQDYKINVLTPPVCATPTAQPTALTLIPSGTSISGSFIVASPAPDNYLVVINTNGTVPTPVNSVTYSVGGSIGAGNTIVSIGSSNSFTATGLTINSTYYLFVFSYNSVCTGGPLYLKTNPLTGTTTTLATNYCIPTGNLNCSTNGDYIANVTVNTLNNSSTCSSGGYTNYPATGTKTTTLTRGNTYNLSVATGPGNKKHGAAVWIDFNQNSVFTDAGEYFFIGNGVIANSTNTIAITIPAGANLGTTRMRVRYGRQTSVTAASSCTMSGTYGETEDYTLTIADPIVCVAPASQPTALILNATGTTITGSFTAPSPAPNNYLVVINTTGIAPSPANTTSYALGGTVGFGNTVVDNDSNTGFVASGLSALTTYYLFVFAYNSACSGGPTYNNISPLSGNTTTITANYCTPSVSSGQQSLGYFSEVSFVGTLNDVSNYSTYSSSPLGYQDFTGLTNLAIQAQGEGVNISVQALNSSFMKAWVDWNKDGDFTDTGELVYSTGGISTYSSTFGFIIPSGTPLGNYRIRLRLNSRDFSFPYDANSTDSFTSCGNINYPGETEDYLFTVVTSCASVISSVTDGRTCGPGTVTLGAASSSLGVTQYRWYTTPTGATLIGTTITGSWTTPSLTATTTYYVTAYNGCESLTRTAVTATVSPIPTLTYSPSDPILCGEDVVIALSATGDSEEVYLINEKFSSGLGVFTNTNILSTAENANSQWQNRSSTFVPTPVTNYNVWFPAISTGVNGNGFAMATSDVGGVTVHNQLASATVNSTNFTSLTLSFRMFYSRYYEDFTSPTLDYVTVDVSTDGGANWIEINRYLEDIGIGTRFETLSFDLSAYINQSNLKVRFRYYGEWCDGLAVDDVKLYGYRPISTALNWTSATTVNAYTDAACTIPYVTNTPAVNVYVKPSITQLEQGSYSFTANATLANGCTTSKTITVTNNSKIWQGITTDWNDSNNWKPIGVPTAANCVVIPSTAIISGSGYNAFAKTLTVKSAGNLEVQTANNITVTDEVKVDTNGIFYIRNNSSLVQINNASNTGIVKMERITQPMYRFDFTYWGTPMAFASNFTLGTLSPNTLSDKYFSWNPTLSNGYGQWIYETAATIMNPVKGYIVRAPQTFSFTSDVKVPYTATFIGTPNNGDISCPIYHGTLGAASNNDKYNLLGNPYPCAVDAEKFLSDPANVPVIDGTIYFWTHNSGPSTANPDPYYGDYILNYSNSDYASWNKLGGTGTTAAAASGGATPAGFIAAGQGFFSKSTGTAVSGTPVVFKNTMRTTGNNSQFFRTSAALEKHRIWLNLVNSSGAFNQILVGYVEGGKYGWDRDFDGAILSEEGLSLYSIIPDKKLVIQGRPLPFDNNDVVPLGYRAVAHDTYSIRLNRVDGLFETQNIFIEDKLLGIIHDLKQSPYNFTSEAGTFDDRFVLRYTATTLAATNSETNFEVLAYIDHGKFFVRASENISGASIFDITGKEILDIPENQSKNVECNFNFAEGVYMTKIKLQGGVTITRKLINSR